ncbi:MAG: hypothetical protein NTX50_02170 [Candidatus Sumerlaeota bacterium]|nr:hypothetical protein [Candidatus Sumerlaeota bacterium]
MIQDGTINTVAQIALIVLGFVGFLIEFISDSFRKGEKRHNVLRVITLVILLLVAALGWVTYHYGKVLARQAEAELNMQLEKFKTRHLTSEQNTTLETMARKACTLLPTVIVTAANSNNEAQVYALEFVKLLKAAGCVSDLVLPIPSLMPDVVGIHIGVRDPQNLPPGAIELSKILSSSGIQFSITPIKPDFFPDAPFVLVVGAKE